MSLAGGCFKSIITTRAANINVGGDNRSIYLFDKDAPDLDISNPSYDPTIYSTSPDSDLQNGSTANYFQPNGLGQNKVYQCNFPYKSDGSIRSDFWFIATVAVSTTVTRLHRFCFGIFPKNTSNTNQRVVFYGEGLAILQGVERVNLNNYNDLIITGDINDVRQDRAEWTFDNCFCSGDLYSQTPQISGQRHAFINSIITGWTTAPSTNLVSQGNVKDSIFVNIPKDFDNIGTGFEKARIYQLSGASLTDFEYSNLENQAASGTNISLPANFNLVAFNDFTLKIDSPHFRNGGANQSANIGNAKYGIPLYRGAADNNDGGLVSDVADVDQLATWTEGTNSFSTSFNLSPAVLLSGFKLIGAEQLTQSFDYSNYDITTGVFSSVPSLPTDYSKKTGRPVIYARFTVNGNTIPFTNDLPSTVDALPTANYIPLQLDTGAQYFDNEILINGSGDIVFTDVQTDFIPNESSNTKIKLRDYLFGLLSNTGTEAISVSLICYFHDKSEANLFQGITAVGSQNIIRDVNLIAGVNVLSVNNATNWRISDNTDLGDVDLVFNSSTGLTIPFGFDRKYTSIGDFSLTTTEGTRSFNNLVISERYINVLDNGDGTVTLNITINEPSELPIIRERTIKVVQPCENPVLVRWLNRLGGIDRWVFEWNQNEAENVDSNELYQENFFDIENQETILNYIRRTGRKQITLQAENIEKQAIQGIRSIAYSNLVQLYDSKRGVWLTITLQDTLVGAFDTKRNVGDISLTFNLPEIYTNGN